MSIETGKNGDSKDATPFVAMILCEVLELRAMNEVHGLLLQTLIKEKGATADEVVARYRALVREARGQVYDKLEAKIREIWPDQVHLLKTLYRDE